MIRVFFLCNKKQKTKEVKATDQRPPAFFVMSRLTFQGSYCSREDVVSLYSHSFLQHQTGENQFGSVDFGQVGDGI